MPRKPPPLTTRPAGTPAPRENRPSAAKRGYGRRWETARLLHLADYPLCVHCEHEGRVVEATVVDHVIPHRGDDDLFWDQTNWQSLCSTCHNRKTGSGE